MIDFEEVTEVSKFYDPTKNEVIEETIIIRKDPLTGKRCRIVQKDLPISRNADIQEEITGGFCPFCPDTIYEIGARDNRVMDNELGEEGEAVLLANISPYAERSLVIRLTEEHYLPLDDFKEKQFTDGFKLIQEYLKGSPDELYSNMMMNYLKPAGSSIVHPHMQVLMSRSPMDYLKRMMDGLERYPENYYRSLLEEVEERYIGDTGEIRWMTPFAPRGLEHVQGIALEGFTSLDPEGLNDISRGITNTLKYYSSLGLNSFNICITPVERIKEPTTIVDIVARSSMDRYYWCDVFALSKLMDEPYSNKFPEDVAEAAKRFFEK